MNYNHPRPIAESICRRWTKGAIYCLESNADCKNCDNYCYGFDKDNNCRMPQSVEMLVTTIGMPDTQPKQYQQKGSRRLNDAQIKEIRRRAALKESLHAIARDFPVTHPTIRAVVLKRGVYQHV